MVGPKPLPKKSKSKIRCFPLCIIYVPYFSLLCFTDLRADYMADQISEQYKLYHFLDVLKTSLFLAEKPAYFAENGISLYSLRASDAYKLAIIIACTAPSPYLNPCCNTVDWTHRSRLQWNLNQNSYNFIQENAYKNVVWKITAILSWPLCVNYGMPCVLSSCASFNWILHHYDPPKE